GGSASGAAFGQGAAVIGRDDPATAPRGGERRVAVGGGDVENALVGAQVAGFAERLADDLQGRADDGVVAARPGGALARLEGSEVGGCVHATAPVRRERPLQRDPAVGVLARRRSALLDRPAMLVP